MHGLARAMMTWQLIAAPVTIIIALKVNCLFCALCDQSDEHHLPLSSTPFSTSHFFNTTLLHTEIYRDKNT